MLKLEDPLADEAEADNISFELAFVIIFPSDAQTARFDS